MTDVCSNCSSHGSILCSLLVTEPEKRILRKMFMGLANRLDGKHICKEDFLQLIRLPGILGERGFCFFDRDQDGLISYEEFENGLGKICRGDKQHLYDFIFFIFEGKEEGSISVDDFRLMMSHLPPSIIIVLVKQVGDQSNDQAVGMLIATMCLVSSP